MKFFGKMNAYVLSLVILFSVCPVNGQNNNSIIHPQDHFGFMPGADGMLFDYAGLIQYLKILDEASPMLKMLEIGKSPMGKSMYIAFISSSENISRLDEFKEINRELALNPDIPDAKRKEMIDKGKVFVMSAHSLHSSEVGPAQSVPLIAHKLITSDDPLIKQRMEDIVYMIVPNPNPDGMDMIVNNYNKYKGTKYEGASLPAVYHKYVGHDNNRDFVILSQEDTKVLSRIFCQDWFPQVYADKHQMGSTGIRYFVMPFHDPISEMVDADLWNWAGIFGANMLKDMTSEGLDGVGTHTIFDLYWPGASLTAIWKNVIGMLTESASAKTAKPIFIEPNELSVRGKGLSEYKKGVNLPQPWEGGRWSLGDIIEYEMSSTMSLLKTASLHKDAILQFKNDICRKEVNNGRTKAPFYYVLPKNQKDISEFVKLVNLIREHGLEAYELKENYTLTEKNLFTGDVVIPLAQPFRAFLREVMESQDFPVRHYTPGGEIIKPYDITSWSLPMHRNVKSYIINERNQEFELLLNKIESDYSLATDLPENYLAAVFSANSNGSYKAAFTATARGIDVERTKEDIIILNETIPAGSFIMYAKTNNRQKINDLSEQLKFSPIFIEEKIRIETMPLKVPRIAFIETFFRNMDAGWTRFILDSYNIPFTVIRPGNLKEADLIKDYDLVIIPNTSKSLLMTGKMRPDGSYLSGSAHPDYIKGMGDEGIKQLMTFVDKGGLIVAWGQSTELFDGKLEIENEEFHLPYNVNNTPYDNGLYVPGSLLQVEILPDHPLSYGMPHKTGIYFSNSQILSTSVPGFGTDRRVIARYTEKDILLSGYSENEKLLANKSAMIWLQKGKGQLVLFGFSPQFRASTQASYKLLFNAMLLQKPEK